MTTLRDALRDVPGVSLAAGEGGQQGDNLSIRGFNAQNDFYLDGMRDFGSYYRDPFDLESVEVLKGPASVLFGRGSTGGVINQVSKQPQLAPVTAGTVAFGTDGTKRTTVDMDRAIPGLAGRRGPPERDGRRERRGRTRRRHNRRFGLRPPSRSASARTRASSSNYLHEQSLRHAGLRHPLAERQAGAGQPAELLRLPDHDYFRTNVDIGTARVEHDFNDRITVTNQSRYGSYRRDLRVTEPLITGYTTSQDIVPARVPLERDPGQPPRHRPVQPRNDARQRDRRHDPREHRPGEHVDRHRAGSRRQTSDPTRYLIAQPRTSLLFPDTSAPFILASPVSSVRAGRQHYAAYVTDTVKLGPQLELIGGWRFDRYDSKFKQTVAPAVLRQRATTTCRPGARRWSTSRSRTPACTLPTAPRSTRRRRRSA